MITFYGASDDLIEIGGSKDYDEVNVYPRYQTDDSMVFDVVMVDDENDVLHGMRVRAVYDGAWSFAVGSVHDGDPDEPYPFPAWPVYFRQGEPASSYSIVLEIDAPVDAVVKRLKDDEE